MRRHSEECPVTVYWATLLDNVVAGYNAKTRCFSKEALPFLKFQDRCFFVKKEELPLGIAKAKHIAYGVTKHPARVPTLCVLEAQFLPEELFQNNEDGFGVYRKGNEFPVSQLFLLINDEIEPFSEEALRALQQKEQI
ncbi:MAG: hypothetical protein AAB539_04065 [Patescibacteria group bacterium]